MYNVITIADTILKLAKEKGQALTPMQLMKLVYIAHGWSLALRDTDLFADRIEAWRYGPVIPDLYFSTKTWGRNPIPLHMISGGLDVDQSTETFLRDVFDKYGHLDGIALSHMTHKPSTPWSQVYEAGRNVEIPDSLIETHYRQLLDDRSGVAAPD
ncbi:putative phage-associated protein [Paenochrobactrum gallinarii]|uniref:Putative phage-associated protein n=1 Tax=Paenochrobactrum gallinarii TaxID=643673 RepID=A0A841M8F9_9HYPH|nr:type II toxin-antitoxin system antitoxin SocA domain-containing protein [Paenochrobactrum gallinarii]MBB6262521.1 putative phage-associated protein [Paenochrobactrum gallinarii]